jgi:hypothetical protein
VDLLREVFMKEMDNLREDLRRIQVISNREMKVTRLYSVSEKAIMLPRIMIPLKRYNDLYDELDVINLRVRGLFNQLNEREGVK